MDERKLAKVAELKVVGAKISQRSLQRLRQAYRDSGLIGLAAIPEVATAQRRRLERIA